MPVISSFLGNTVRRSQLLSRCTLMSIIRPIFTQGTMSFGQKFLIDSLAVKEGKLPPRILGLVTEWAELHKDELMENWNSIRETGHYKQIQPLI